MLGRVARRGPGKETAGRRGLERTWKDYGKSKQGEDYGPPGASRDAGRGKLAKIAGRHGKSWRNTLESLQQDGRASRDAGRGRLGKCATLTNKIAETLERTQEKP